MTKWPIKIYICISLWILCGLPFVYSQAKESDYQKVIQTYLGGAMEVKLEGGRADIVNDEHAIEVEFASKWKNAIGQSLWYGLQTSKQPGIVLIVTKKEDYKHAIRLGTAIEYAGLTEKIKVWVYPDDFKGARILSPNKTKPKN